MKITEKLSAAEREDRLWWSFEFFPPVNIYFSF